MCLEGFLAKAAKAPFRLLRNYGVPIGFGAGVVGVYASYLAATGQLPELERMKERLFDAELWQNTTSVLPALAVGAVGVFAAALAIENTSRKRKGKKPINIGKYLKRTFFPPKGIVDEERMRQMLDTFPDSSIAHRQIGDFFFRNDKPAEAMESYYHAMAARDREFLTKIPVFGTNGYVNGVAGRIRELESAARGGSLENSELLELAMRYFLLRDFDRAIEYFDKIDKEEDEFGFHILGSRLYSEAGKMAVDPAKRTRSCSGRGRDSSICPGSPCLAAAVS